MTHYALTWSSDPIKSGNGWPAADRQSSGLELIAWAMEDRQRRRPGELFAQTVAEQPQGADGDWLVRVAALHGQIPPNSQEPLDDCLELYWDVWFAPGATA